MQLLNPLAPVQTTFANRPALTAYPAYTPIVFTDVGATVTRGDIGSQWYHDNTSWRPVSGVCPLYTLGSNYQSKTTNMTTESIHGQVLIPAGLIATTDHRIMIRHTLAKSGTSNSANYAFRLGTAGTTSDTLITNAAVTQPTGTSRQGQNERFFNRVNATSITQPFNGTGAYGTTTVAPQTPITVSNMDSNALYLSVGLFLTTGSETLELRQFDVYLEA